MTDENRQDEREEGASAGGGTSRTEQAGDPGRTPGAAEGDRATVEEDLEQKQGGN